MTRMKTVGVTTALVLTVGLVLGFGGNRVKKTTVNGSAWFDKFADAQAEAKRTNKPILLLSMFGRLDEDMPCANARTLRATLFKDPEFKKLISDEVVPVWEMVRPVPHIQIDLGDGKKITRTARGNAVMYLCNPDGKVVDAYPGIYTTADFMPAIHESITALAHSDYGVIEAWHKERGRMIPRSATTLSKRMAEGPTLALIGARPIPGAVSNEVPTDPARRIFLTAAAQITDSSLTPASAADTTRMVTGAPANGRSPEEIAKEVLAVDSKTNMERTRPVIHLWLASEKELPTPEAARDTVLGTILKIPYKDPYFGLKDVLMPGTPE